MGILLRIWFDISSAQSSPTSPLLSVQAYHQRLFAPGDQALLSSRPLRSSFLRYKAPKSQKSTNWYCCAVYHSSSVRSASASWSLQSTPAIPTGGFHSASFAFCAHPPARIRYSDVVKWFNCKGYKCGWWESIQERNSAQRIDWHYRGGWRRRWYVIAPDEKPR